MLSGDIGIGAGAALASAESLWASRGAVGMNAGAAIIWLIRLGFVLFLAYVLVSEYLDRRLGKKLVRAARAVEVAEGVTLLEGLEAYFGQDGVWHASTDRRAVCVLAKAGGYPRASLWVYPETGRIEVYSFRRTSDPSGRDEPEALMETIIQAARSKKAEPWA